MKKYLLLLTLNIFSLGIFSQNFHWAMSVGDAINTRESQGKSIKVDKAGNSYCTGFFTGVADFDPGPGTFTLSALFNIFNAFILKLDISGNFVWAKSFDCDSRVAGLSIALDSIGNIFTTGYFSGTADFNPGSSIDTLRYSGLGYNIFVSKLDANGNFIWAKNIGGNASNYSNSITTDKNGNVYTTGYFTGTTDFDPGVGTFTLTSNGDDAAFVLKLDSLGNFIWSKRLGNVGSDTYSSAITVDDFGNSYVAGHFYGTVDFNPGTATYSLSSNGNEDIFVLKLDASGNFIWAKRIGGNLGDGATAIVNDRFNNLYLTGYFYNTVDFDPNAGTQTISSYGVDDIFVLKLNTLGNFMWAKKLGSISNEAGYGIATDLDGNVYTTGNYKGVADFDPGAATYNLIPANGVLGNNEVFISKLDSSGAFGWAKSIGSPNGYENGNSITVDKFGNVYTTGYFSGTADFDCGTGTYTLTTSYNLEYTFIVKLGDMATGLSQIYKKNPDFISIYPNPNNGNFTIVAKENMKLNLINDLGQILQTTELNKENNFQQNINVLSSGIYFISGRSEKGPIHQKIIVTQ